MPLYEYRCTTCGEMEEKIQGYSAATEHECPKCGVSNGMQRQISQVAFNLSGGGWFAQGYAGEKGPEKTTPAPAAGGCCGGACACKPGA